MRPPSQKNWKIFLICIIVIVLITGIAVYNLPREEYITMEELREDSVKQDGGGGFFIHYNSGDTLKVKDIILDMETTSPSSNQTYIWFQSSGKDGYGSALVFYGTLILAH